MPAKKSDLDALQGTWSVSTLELDGQTMEAVPPDACITVKGARFTTSGMGADYKGDMTLDDSGKPKTFDLKFTSGPEKGNTALGIYELKGDQWKMCLTTQGGKRPAKFATRAGTGHALQSLVRAGSAKPKAPKVAGAAAAPSGDAAPELDGEWSMEKLVMDGKALDAPMLAWGRRIAKDGEVVVMMGPQTVLQARFAVERSHTPMWLNYVHSKTGASQLGIYKLEGSTLTTCMAKPGAARPDTFESRKGDGRTFGIWKR